MSRWSGEIFSRRGIGVLSSCQCNRELRQLSTSYCIKPTRRRSFWNRGSSNPGIYPVRTLLLPGFRRGHRRRPSSTSAMDCLPEYVLRYQPSASANIPYLYIEDCATAATASCSVSGPVTGANGNDRRNDGRNETIALTRNCLNETRLLGVVFQNPPDLPDRAPLMLLSVSR